MCLPTFQVLLQTKKMEQPFHYLTCLSKSLLYKRKRIDSKTGSEVLFTQCSHKYGRLKIMARTKPPSDKELKIRLPKNELELLEAYCIKHGKTKTEVLREWIRSLKLDS